MEVANNMDVKKEKYFSDFKQELINGITYYRNLMQLNDFTKQRENFIKNLNDSELELEAIFKRDFIETHYKISC